MSVALTPTRLRPPGLGQLYNRHWGKGVLFLAAGIVLGWLVARVAPTDPRAVTTVGRALLVPLVLLVAVFLWSVVDAWRGAGRDRRTTT